MSNSHWKLLTYVNITNYNEKQSRIQEINNKIKESCELGNNLKIEYTKHVCMQYSNQAASFLTEINSNKNHVIKIVEQPKSYNIRARRGLINMVGRVANVLFGVCDDTDAKYFHDKIKELERSKSQLFQTTETQTQIMKSMLTNVNSSLIELEKKQGSLVDGYNHLLHKTDVIEMDVGILKFQNALDELQSHFKRNVVDTTYDSNHYLLIGVIVMVSSVGLLLVLVLLFLMYKNYQNKEIVSKTYEDLGITHSPESPLPRII